jgi:hypothetical protein
MVMMERIDTSQAVRLERRRFQRWDLDRQATLSAQEQGIPARCLDVSVGGALLRLQAEVPVPSQVLLYLHLSSLPEGLAAVLARVVEVSGRRVRVSFDPLPAYVATALAAEVRLRRPPSAVPDRSLLN